MSSREPSATRTVRLRELLLGVEGLALLRHLYDGSDAEADARVAEIRRILDDPSLVDGEPMREADPRAGYRAWSARYDEPGNPVVELEEPAVRSLLRDVPPGRALDAACGTGRHARHLAELGHEVVGVDLTPEMLERARRRVPGATFREGDLRDLPAPDGAFDLVVCGLALAHLPDLAPAVAELARVLRPGGRLVASVLHPFQARLGWHAPFRDADGARAFVREHPHAHADHLAAFRSAGLTLRDCLEPSLTEAAAPAKRRAFRHIPDATVRAYAGLPAVLVWDLERPAGGEGARPLDDRVYVGNAGRDAPLDRGWLLGHFKAPGDPRHSEDVEIKWGVHPPGDERAEWVRGEERTALLVLVRGRFRVELPGRSVLLCEQGDYVVWGQGVDHSWRAEEESVVLTVRWPSVPGYRVPDPRG